MSSTVKSTLTLALCAGSLFAADGAESFKTRSQLCHGIDGTGSDRAKSILATAAGRRPDQLAMIIEKGVPSKGMPAFKMPADELEAVIAHLKDLARKSPAALRDPRAPVPRNGSLPLASGSTLKGVILNESGFDAQLRTPDGKINLLRREGDKFR